MGRSPRENVALSKRRETVADLYLQGWPQTAIAKQVGVAQSTVSADLKVVQRQWRDSAVRDFDVAREVEIRKLDRVEREAWAAFERSKQPSQSAVMSTDGSEQKTQKIVKEQHGDARFLDQVLKCITSRRALLGLDAPTRIAPTSPDGDEAYHSHVMSELMRIAEEAKDGPVIVDANYVTQEVDRAIADNRPATSPTDENLSTKEPT